VKVYADSLGANIALCQSAPMASNTRPVFPFTAIVAQEEMKLALIVTAVDPTIGGVLVFGDRGTGKSTAIRALAALLPPMAAVIGCRYACDPMLTDSLCDECSERSKRGKLKHQLVAVPVVDMPLGVTEDRVVGALDLEKALSQGIKAFEPGLLARANRGFLYIDEVNLLEDHLVDLLIDVAASGENLVEREGLSVRHPARFVLIGSGNPEEGELRPQLLDRFGLSVEVKTPIELAVRMEVIRRRDEFDRDRPSFIAKWKKQESALRRRIVNARKHLPGITIPDQVLEAATQLCLSLGTDGLRAELTLMRAARAFAAFESTSIVNGSHLRQVAHSCLRHRLRRDPLDEAGSSARLDRAVLEVFGE
jgi:magnesium chelatase subunit I